MVEPPSFSPFLEYFKISESEAKNICIGAIKAANEVKEGKKRGAALLYKKGDMTEIIYGCMIEELNIRPIGAAIAAGVIKGYAITDCKAAAVYVENPMFPGYPMPNAIGRNNLLALGLTPILFVRSPNNYIVRTPSSLLPGVLGMDLPPILGSPSNDIETVMLAHHWLRIDHYKPTRDEIEGMIARDDIQAMKTALTKRIDFGTAGLRGKMAAGYANMNYVIVQQTAQGLARFLINKFGVEESKKRGVIIGYDARYNSKGYANITAAILKKHGIEPLLYEDITVTPMVPYGVLKYGCMAGVMVTASHNPKLDNGYKVYAENGAQIIEPNDRLIRECIKECLVIGDYSDLYDYNCNRITFEVEPLKEKTMVDYIKVVGERLIFMPKESLPKCGKITYTAMHGVGHHMITRIFKDLGFNGMYDTKEQIVPDPEFPTVIYPNPEEGEGALTLAIKTAESVGSSLILANDPDADRLAMAERQQDGTWKIFSGDEIGAIFGSYFIQVEKSDIKKCGMVASTVSSKMLRGMAEKHGFHFEETLTGFKWISNKVIDLEKEGKKVLFSYEEAIGYSMGDVVRDKDGVSAAIVMAQLYTHLTLNNQTMAQYLDKAYQAYGYYITKNKYFLCFDPLKMKQIFDEMRAMGGEGKYPTTCAGFKIKNIRDLTTGYDTNQPDNKAVLPTSASSQMITWEFENGGLCTLRGSGTEPKLKYYIEYHDSTREKTEEILIKLHRAIVDTFLQPEKFGLIPPLT